MKTILYFFFAIVGCIRPLPAQDLPATHYKYQVTLGICRQVSNSFNDLRKTPGLSMPKGKSNRIARFNPEPEMKLSIDEKVYDLCREMGKDSLSALAFIVSHELTHFFFNHRHPFGFAMPETKTGEWQKEIEKDADLFGLIQAFAAGYQTFDVAQPILEKIYLAYQLPDNLTGYPTRQERLELIATYTQQAGQLASTFEVGKFLYLKGEYAAAEHCFANLSTRIPAKEFLNALGLAQLQQVLTSGWFRLKEMPFKLSVELDVENRLLGENRQGNEAENSKIEAQLESAIQNFRKAIYLDKSYEAAHLNLSSALLLLGRNGTSKELFDDLEKNGIKLSPNAHLLRAIASLRLKENLAAQRDLDRAGGAFEIEFNRKIAALLIAGAKENEVNEWIEKYTLGSLKSTSRAAPMGIERSINKLSLPLPDNFAADYRQNLPSPDLVHFQYGAANGLHAYKILLKEGSFHVIQAYSSTPALVTSKGIRQGDSLRIMQAQYGNPSRIIPVAGGDYYCYDKIQIYFRIRDSLVQDWLIYQKVASSN